MHHGPVAQAGLGLGRCGLFAAYRAVGSPLGRPLRGGERLTRSLAEANLLALAWLLSTLTVVARLLGSGGLGGCRRGRRGTSRRPRGGGGRGWGGGGGGGGP